MGLRDLQARISVAAAQQAPIAKVSTVGFVDTLWELFSNVSTDLPGIEHLDSPDHQMTREQVLEVLDIPTAKLMEALETAAVPDPEWLAIEAIAHNNIEAKRQGAPCDDVWVNTRPHLRFLEAHAPYHVRRLQNGGVMLATHPYRTLWPLWSKALDLLGIRPLHA